MTLALRGKTYETEFLDLLQLSIGESRTLKRNCVGLSGKAMTGADWRECVIAFDREDPDLFAGIVFLLRSRAGEIVQWSDLEDLTVKEFTEGLSIVNDEVVELPDPPDPPAEPVEAAVDTAA
jgi:hypothetical protein